MKRPAWFLLFLCVTAASLAPALGADKIKVMIIGGQNSHDWARTIPLVAKLLQKGGHFEATVYNTPPNGAKQEQWDAWKPKFRQFDCVVLDYKGQMWPEAVKKDFVDYIRGGGGVLLIHAANNSFGGWKEFEQMVGLLWRPPTFGYSLYIDDQGKLVREEPGKGRKMGHGSMYDWVMTTRDSQHPITQGMPVKWMHKFDELYHGQRGPAENINILLTAYSDPAHGGTGKNEPIVWWVPYGKGHVVVNLMGHVYPKCGLACLQCVGFKVILYRACEWLATGKCLTPIPESFPTAEQTSIEK